MASNATMAQLAALVGPLGLLLMVYGLLGIHRAIVEDDTAAALARFGVLSMTPGRYRMDTLRREHILAETRIQSEQAIQAAIPIHEMGVAITLISTMGGVGGRIGIRPELVVRRHNWLPESGLVGDRRGLHCLLGGPHHRAQHPQREHGHAGQALLFPVGDLVRRTGVKLLKTGECRACEQGVAGPGLVVTITSDSGTLQIDDD